MMAKISIQEREKASEQVGGCCAAAASEHALSNGGLGTAALNIDFYFMPGGNCTCDCAPANWMRDRSAVGGGPYY
jgi:hypothetical protein